MNIFYIPTPESKSIVLPEEESIHCVRVLRMKPGDGMELMDGNGSIYQARITNAHDKKCEVEITGEPVFVPKRSFRIQVAIAPTKSIDRFEWFLEKATEIGIDKITPVYCEHSERTVLKTDRLQKVLVAAMKQSRQAWLPLLDAPVRFKDFVFATHEEDRFICTCKAGNDLLLKKCYRPSRSVTILIGPEGDFTENEIQQSLKAGFLECSLGASRLRTETAGIAACHTIHLLNP